jgi:hypothetical protein
MNPSYNWEKTHESLGLMELQGRFTSYTVRRYTQNDISMYPILGPSNIYQGTPDGIIISEEGNSFIY